MPDDRCAIYIDAGTSNTRLWLMRGGDIVAFAGDATGIRDAAREISSSSVMQALLRELIEQVSAKGRRTSDDCTPAFVIACGMIGSSLGLAEVPHVPAPAGVTDLAYAAQWRRFPSVTELPILLVPGVRSGPAHPSVDSISECDVMRGEETLCAGLVAARLIECPTVVLNLGSHWKAIHLDANGTIQSSVSSLSGELIRALQIETILAGSVVNQRPNSLSANWIDAGMAEYRRSGLSRALFCVRLLDLSAHGTAEDRFSFLAGIVIAAELDALVSRGALRTSVPVSIVGHAGIAEAWRHALSQQSIPAGVVPAKDSERALLSALRQILRESLQLQAPEPIPQRATSR